MPEEPLVVRTLREYRELLGAKDIALQEDLARMWVRIERRLEADITALAYEMERRAKDGEMITQQIIWRSERYKALKAKIEAEIKRYNGEYLSPTIEAYQREVGWLGISASKDAIMASFQESFAPYFPVLNRGAVETMIGYLGNGAPLNTLLKKDYPDALNGLIDALVNGIARGSGPSEIAKEMTNGFGMGFDRALLIARTEVNRTYRAASTMQYRASGVVTGFRRLVKKETACVACLMLDGETFGLEKELDDHPNGKCVAVPDVRGVKPAQWETGQEWFMTLDTEIQRSKLGDEKYELWKSGTISLDQLAGKHHSEVWGDSPKVLTLRELADIVSL